MNSPETSKRTIAVEHVTITSANSFDAVKEKLESLVPHLDESFHEFLQRGEHERALRVLEALPPLSIFGSRDHGRLLTIADLRRRAIQYEIGNPFTASKMTRRWISAAVYAPIRVLLREGADGEVAFEYDRPVSIFGQFNDDQVDVVAGQLDSDLQASLQAAAS